MYREKSLEPEITSCKVKSLLIICYNSENNEYFSYLFIPPKLENTRESRL